MNYYPTLNKPVLQRHLEPGLETSIGVVDEVQAGLASFEGHLHRLRHLFGLQARVHMPADDLA